MQQFQVPQFITVEDRIIGPLTLKQFFYLLGGAGVLILGFFFLHIFLFIIIALPIGGLFIAMAFAKINGQPFPTIFASAINYYLKPRLYLWQPAKPGAGSNEQRAMSSEQPQRPTSPLEAIPKLTAGKLSDLAWSLDITKKIDR